MPPLKHSKKPQKPSPHKPPAEESRHGNSKGKQPIRPPPGQPAEASSRNEKSLQLPLGRSKPAKAETTEPHPEQTMRPDTERKQPQEISTKQTVQTDPKGPQLMSQMVYQNPQFFIARIPVKRDARVQTTAVYIGPDTAFRHPQTFFFKNIPSVDHYWGYTNYKAWTGRRIVRLEREGNPTPYFLMVCRGEYPKVTSYRNDNWIFERMHEPIFGDAFVFKLGEPELYEDGYARYVHIDVDIGRSKWLQTAIRNAARKVDSATASSANPGFPNIRNYADRETMAKDTQRMFNMMTAIKKANQKYGTAFPIDAKTGLPDPERMEDVLKEWARQVLAWKQDNLLPDENSESPDSKTLKNFIDRATDAYLAINIDVNGADATTDEDETSSSATEVESPDNTLDEVITSFMAARDAFVEVKIIAKERIVRKVLTELVVTKSTEKVDLSELRLMIDSMKINVASWRKEFEVSAVADSESFNPKVIDDFIRKARAACRTMEEGMGALEVVNAINELSDTFQTMSAAVGKREASSEMETAKAGAAGEADAADTSKLPDLPGHPGTSAFRVERLN